MKKIVALFMAVLLGVGTLAGCSQTATDPLDPVATAENWIETQVKENTLFSFDFDGVSYADHIKKWKKSVDKSEGEWIVTYKNGKVTARSEISLDKDTASVEWTNYFINDGDADSPVISNIQAIDSSVSVANPQFTTAEGSLPSIYDFQPIHVDLVKSAEYTMSTMGGRSSQGAFPYFEIYNGEYGVFGAIGWTGDWSAKFVNQDGVIRITAGMQKTNIALHAGEDMRTPMIMLQFYRGDQADGHNAFRQLMLKNYSPKDEEGKTFTSLPVFVSIDASRGEDYMIATLKNVLQKNRQFDGMWIDATWYGDIKAGSDLDSSGWADQVGNWYFIKDLYPNGNMLKTSDWLEENDKELLVWFEPERVMANTAVANEHPEWVLGDLNSKERLLFDFSKDDARDYMIDLIDGLIKKNKIDWYRQDFNMDPASKWKLGDEGKNRVGMTEIKYITNLYYFLDELVARNPGLMIDNCASGGKRLDLEMMSRSFPLWRTDISTSADKGGTPDSIRSISYNLSWWIPLHGGGYPNYLPNDTSTTYNMRCYFTGGSMRASYQEEGSINDIVDAYYEYRDLLSGEYYMLDYGMHEQIETKPSAYEYYRPEQGRGIIMAFCPAKGETCEVVFKLKGLDADATYRVEVQDSGDSMEFSGKELMENGLLCRFPDAGFSMLIYFNKI